MSARSDKGVELFKSGLNCAQAVVGAFAADFGLSPELAAKVSCGLGGGVGRMREVCGTVTGASIVLGLKYGEDKSVVYPYVQKFCEEFKAENGSIVCHELLAGTGATKGGAPEARTETYYKKRPCVELVRYAIELLEKQNEF